MPVANCSTGAGAASISGRVPDGGLQNGADHVASKACASDADRAIRCAILQALDLPPEAVPLFLQHIEQFCHGHGGEHHYAKLLALLASYRDLA